MHRRVAALSIAIGLLTSVAAADEAGAADAASDAGSGDAGEPVMAPPEEEDGGCSCWWDGGNAERGALALPVIFALFARRRMRRRD